MQMMAMCNAPPQKKKEEEIAHTVLILAMPVADMACICQSQLAHLPSQITIPMFKYLEAFHGLCG